MKYMSISHKQKAYDNWRIEEDLKASTELVWESDWPSIPLLSPLLSRKKIGLNYRKIVKLMLYINHCVINLVLLCLWPRRPRRGFQNWARWRPGMSWAVEKRAAARTVMMKMDVKPQETIKARHVSKTCLPSHAQTSTYIHKSTLKNNEP